MNLRKQLGRLKYNLFDVWPYRHAMQRAVAYRKEAQSLLSRLPPLTLNPHSPYEIHMLCGHRDVDMGIWATWSLHRFLPDSGMLYIHSDGTLTQGDEDLWTGVLKGAAIVDRRDASSRVSALLAPVAPRLENWARRQINSIQLIDVHCYGESKALLVMDSDVLVFHRPDEVIEELVHETPTLRWSEDLINAYLAPLTSIEKATGIRIPPRLCCGFIVTPRLSIKDFIAIDDFANKMHLEHRTAVQEWWANQTYYAAVAAGYPRSGPFPSSYSNTKTATSESQPIRHYVGIPRVRHRYFLEGLPRLIREAGLSLKTLPR